MIDKNGKRITPASEDNDKEFLLSEIRFMTKSFKNESNDQKAERLARRINDYISTFKDAQGPQETFMLLEEYTKNTQSEDFLWEMVYIMRKKTSLDENQDSLFCGDCYYASAMYFEKICFLDPTTYNMCCEVSELLSASDNYYEVKTNLKTVEKARCILEIAEERFSKIQDDGSMIYSETGQELYRTKYIQCESQEKDEHDILKELARFSVELFYRSNDIKTLKYTVLVYKEYSSLKFFVFEYERETLYKLVNYIDKLPPDKHEYISIQNDLKSIIDKCLSRNST